MKARIKETGEIVEVISWNSPCTITYLENGGVSVINGASLFEILPEKSYKNEPDWEQRRYELAKAAMQGLLSNSVLSMIHDNEWIAFHSVWQADAMISELKKQKP